MNDIIVLFRHRDSSFYRDLFASSRQLKINEHVSTRQERSTYCGKVTGTIAVRNNVSSGRDCLRHISARLSDNKAAAPVFVHAISKMHRETFDFHGKDEISGRSGAVKRYSASSIYIYIIFFFFLSNDSERMALFSSLSSFFFLPQICDDRHVGRLLAAHWVTEMSPRYLNKNRGKVV